MENPKSILITGATSGIGTALARSYAGSGTALALTGRDADRLKTVAARCAEAGAQVRIQVLDVRDRDALADWMRQVDAACPLELVIANAGVSAGTGGGGEGDDQANRIFDVNLIGVTNTIQPAISLMAPRRRGQLAIMSSLASFCGFPGAPAYCASKAAVRVWGESLRGGLHGAGLAVSVICPGYVRTPMTAVNDFPMPFLMDADRAARIIRRGLRKNKARIAFPWPLYATVMMLASLPPGLLAPLLRRLPEKVHSEDG